MAASGRGPGASSSCCIEQAAPLSGSRPASIVTSSDGSNSLAAFEKRAPVAERTLPRCSRLRKRSADRTRRACELFEAGMAHGGAPAGVVEIDRAGPGRPQVDQHERPLHRDERGKRLGSMKPAMAMSALGRMQRHLPNHVFGRSPSQSRTALCSPLLAVRAIDTTRTCDEGTG